MTQSIYLHRYVVDTLSLFGELSDVINRILQEGADGKIQLVNRPPCTNRKGAGRYNVNITQQDYLELLEYYPVNSSKVSIRRLLYWFVDFEIYEQLEWKPTRKYENKILQKQLKYVDNARTFVTRIFLLNKNDKEAIQMISTIDDSLVKLKEYLNNDREYDK